MFEFAIILFAQKILYVQKKVLLLIVPADKVHYTHHGFCASSCCVYLSHCRPASLLSSSISSAPESNTSCWDSDIPPILPSLAGRSSVYCSVHPLSLPCAGALSTFLHFPYTVICCSFHVPHVFSFVVGKTVL